MQDKMLYNTAIVSDDIYVERQADRILNDVILRMAKPAYISVSRQMGKTNLLLRTKRHYEDNDNRYIYKTKTTLSEIGFSKTRKI